MAVVDSGRIGVQVCEDEGRTIWYKTSIQDRELRCVIWQNKGPGIGESPKSEIGALCKWFEDGGERRDARLALYAAYMYLGKAEDSNQNSEKYIYIRKAQWDDYKNRKHSLIIFSVLRYERKLVRLNLREIVHDKAVKIDDGNHRPNFKFSNWIRELDI